MNCETLSDEELELLADAELEVLDDADSSDDRDKLLAKSFALQETLTRSLNAMGIDAKWTADGLECSRAARA